MTRDVCVACNCTVHKRCHIKVLGRCPGSAIDSSETKVGVGSIDAVGL